MWYAPPARLLCRALSTFHTVPVVHRGVSCTNVTQIFENQKIRKAGITQGLLRHFSRHIRFLDHRVYAVQVLTAAVMPAVPAPLNPSGSGT